MYVEITSDKIDTVTHQAFVKLSDLSKVFDAPDINSLVDKKMTYLDKNISGIVGFDANKKPVNIKEIDQ